MTLFNIVLKNLKKRILATILTTLSVALGAGLILAILTIQSETEKSFNQTSAGYDLILAAKGSQLQTTLNTLYHIETSTGVVPYALYEAALKDPRVDYAFPFYVGDRYQQYRVIGTSKDYLEKAQPRREVAYAFREGRNFEKLQEAVLGAMVAEETGLKVGDTFNFTHGIGGQDASAEVFVHEDHPVTIVGILEPTGTANDRVIFAELQTTHSVHQAYQAPAADAEGPEAHDHHHADEKRVEIKNLDAVLVKYKSPASALQVAGMINYPVPDNPVIARNLQRDPLFPYREGVMAVSPAVQVSQLMKIIGNVDWILKVVAYLVIIVAITGILVAIYNTMEERRRDIAIMRSLGASRSKILSIIVLESTFICFMGSILGLFLGWSTTAIAAPYLILSAGIFIEPFTFEYLHAMILLLMCALGIIAGTIPGLKAYRTDVAAYLTPNH
jgi:putative ABC transport system permease protein